LPQQFDQLITGGGSFLEFVDFRDIKFTPGGYCSRSTTDLSHANNGDEDVFYFVHFLLVGCCTNN
jgi:hypothetical protein